MALSEQVRNGFLFKLSFTQGVTELESLAATKETLHDPVIVGVLNAVRTRLLDFTMQLEEEEPLAEREQKLPDPKHAANILYTIFYADTANVAVGNRDVTQTQTQNYPNLSTKMACWTTYAIWVSTRI